MSSVRWALWLRLARPLAPSGTFWPWDWLFPIDVDNSINCLDSMYNQIESDCRGWLTRSPRCKGSVLGNSSSSSERPSWIHPTKKHR
jgi:hypothetical protein